MNKNKKYWVIVVLTFIPCIISAERDDRTKSNYLTQQIIDDYEESLPLFLKSRETSKSIDIIPELLSLTIEDKKKTDHVKIIARGVSKVESLEDVFKIKTNNGTIDVSYHDQNRFLFVRSFIEYMEYVKGQEKIKKPNYRGC